MTSFELVTHEPLALSCAQTVQVFIGRTLLSTNATSSRSSLRVGTHSRSVSSKSVATSASLTSFQSIRKNATKSLLSTHLAQLFTIGACLAVGPRVSVLMKKSLRKIGARPSLALMKHTRSQIRLQLPMNKQRAGSLVSGQA